MKAIAFHRGENLLSQPSLRLLGRGNRLGIGNFAAEQQRRPPQSDLSRLCTGAAPKILIGCRRSGAGE